MAVACTDLTQPINRKEAEAIIVLHNAAAEILRNAVRRGQANGHDDAPEYGDECLDLISSAIDSINDELDNVKERAA